MNLKPGGADSSRSETQITVMVAVELPAPIDAVFSYLADLENNPQWNWSVTTTTPLGPPAGVGTRYVQRHAWPQPGVDLLEVSVHRPPHLLEVTGEVEEGRICYRYQLVSLDAIATRLEVTVQLQPTHPKARPDIYSARLGAAVACNFEDLKTVIMHTQFTAAGATR